MTEWKESSSWMMGFSARSGKFGIASTRIFTSSITVRGSSPSFTSMRTVPPLLLAVELRCLIPPTGCRASSIFSTIVSSVSSGDEPG
jgi:hypothetical protein